MERGRARMLVTSLPFIRASDLAREASLYSAPNPKGLVFVRIPGSLLTATVELRCVPSPHGGRRWLVRCPQCSAIRRHLHVHGERVGCRGCLGGGLSYLSWRFSKTRWLREEWRPVRDARACTSSAAPATSAAGTRSSP